MIVSIIRKILGVEVGQLNWQCKNMPSQIIDSCGENLKGEKNTIPLKIFPPTVFKQSSSNFAVYS